MTGKRWTFLVVGDEDTPVRQYSVSHRRLRLVLGAGVFAAVLIAGFALFVGLDGAARAHALQLQVRNEALRGELQQFRTRVARLESSLDELAEKDAQVRNLAGLESLDPEVMEAGVGGPGLGSPESYPLWEMDADAAADAFALTYDLSALERRARLLASSLEEASDSLVAHRELLESTPSILPTSGWLSSRFSQRRMHPIHNRPLPHPGVDIAANRGTPILASAKGRVVQAGWRAGYGLTVEIDHGYGYTTLYGHASKVLVRRGQQVSRGDVIAQVGSTGIATSTHVHYEVRVNGVAQNPANYILPELVP